MKQYINYYLSYIQTGKDALISMIYQYKNNRKIAWLTKIKNIKELYVSTG